MTVTADQLRERMVEVSALEARVSKLVSPPLPFKSVGDFSAATSATFVMPDMGAQQPVWVNGGPTCFVAGIGCQVWWNSGGLQRHMRSKGNGFGLNGSGFLQMFDFRWNMTKLRVRMGTQKSYVSTPGGAESLMSSNSLGNQETNRILRFNPWKIERGDSLVFSIKPMGYEWTPNGPIATTGRFTVVITLSCFRNLDNSHDGQHILDGATK